MTQRTVKSTKTAAVLLGLLFALSGVAQQRKQDVTGSLTMDVTGTGGKFSFRLPPGYVGRSLKSGEELRGKYNKGETTVVWVWGRTESGVYSERRKSWMHDYEELTTRLSGKRANIRTYWQTNKRRRIYSAELNVGNWERGEVQLYMRIDGPHPRTLNTANQIFKSVTFPIPTPERP